MRARLPVLILAALTAAALPALLAAPARAGLYPELWERYYQLYEEQENGGAEAEQGLSEPDEALFPGRLAGDWDEEPQGLFHDAWPARAQTYEILAASSRDLARSIYGLALYTHDLDQSVDLARFEAGAQGFHYSMDQLVGWADAVLAGEFPLYTGEELQLLSWLLQDGALAVEEGRVASTGLVGHVLGAASGRNRSLELNLDHERLHVLWDESPAFKLEWQARWRDLSDAAREEVFAQLSGYDRENLEGIIEEWAVRQNEADATW